MYTSNYYHQDKAICQESFKFLHGISGKRLRNISSYLRMNGIATRVHGSTKKLSKNTLTQFSVEYIIRFLLNYSEENCLLPGHVRGYSHDDIKLLPSSQSKRSIWKICNQAAAQFTSIQVAVYRTFCRVSNVYV